MGLLVISTDTLPRQNFFMVYLGRAFNCRQSFSLSRLPLLCARSAPLGFARGAGWGQCRSGSGQVCREAAVWALRSPLCLHPPFPRDRLFSRLFARPTSHAQLALPTTRSPYLHFGEPALTETIASALQDLDCPTRWKARHPQHGPFSCRASRRSGFGRLHFAPNGPRLRAAAPIAKERADTRRKLGRLSGSSRV
jgi:hypothetical protein